MVVDEIIKHERIFAAIIQACGVIAASFFIPKFLETRRHENDRRDRILVKKEVALAKFISHVNWVLLNQSNYKYYYKKVNFNSSKSIEDKEKIEKYKKLVDDLYNRYIFCEEPYEVSFALAQLEFPEIASELNEFKTKIDEYIKEECTNKDEKISLLFDRYTELTRKMTEILKTFRSNEKKMGG